MTVALFISATALIHRHTVVRHEKLYNEQQSLQTFLAGRAIEDRITRLIGEAGRIVTHSLPELAGEMRDESSVTRLFTTVLKNYPNQLVWMIVDFNGREVLGRSDETPMGKTAKTLAIQWASTYSSKMNAQEDGPFIPPFHITQDVQILGLLYPLKVKRKLWGMLAMAVDLKPLIDRYIVPIRSGRYGAAYVLDGQGRVVYDHETEIIGRSVFDGMHSNYPDVLRLDRRLMSEMSGMDEYSFTVKRGDKVSRKLIAWNTVRVGERKLVVCLSSPDFEIGENLYGLRWQRILSVFLMVIVLAGMSVLFFRKRSETALRESEERFRRLQEATFAGIVIHEEGRILDVNQSISRMTGYGYDELIGREVKIIIAPDWHEVVERSIRSGIKNPYDVEGVRKDGSKYPLELRGRNMPFHGRTVRVVEFRDISDRKQMEEKLRESEEMFRNISASAKDAIIMMDRDGKISFWNAAAEKIFGYSFVEALGKDLHYLLAPERYHKDCTRAIESFRNSGRGSAVGKTLELTALRKDGTEFPVELSVSAVKMKEEWNAIGIIREITERKIAEREKEKMTAALHHSQKMEAVGTLAGGIAHDFNNILAGILGYTELAMMKLPEDSKVVGDLEQVIKAGNRAKALVEQILAVSRQQKQERKPIDIRPLVGEALKLLRATLPATIEIREDIHGDGSVIEGDSAQIHQVLMNLCTNAGHAMREDGGILNVGLQNVEIDKDGKKPIQDNAPGPYVRLTVSDTGQGMEPDVLARIFDPYFTTKVEGEGTGLGLSVVQSIVKAHGGAISLKSEVGKGTTFFVYLPRIVGNEGETDHPWRKSAPGGSERVLFVDDEQILADMGMQMLERLGYSVTARTSSVEALELFRNKPDYFNLVITDMTMPNMTGDTLAARILEIRPDIAVIIITGYSTRITDQKAKSLGISALVMKPVIWQEMATTIREVLNSAPGHPDSSIAEVS